MATPFVRTMGALSADRIWSPLARAAVGVVLLGGWFAWLLLARVSVFETSLAARLEVKSAGRPLEAVLAGQIVATHVEVGQRVTEGEILVELDARAAEQRLAGERARLDALGPQLKARNREIAAEIELAQRQSEQTEKALAGARARYAQQEELSRFSNEELRRTEGLYKSNASTEQEWLRVRQTAWQHSADSEVARIEVNRLLLQQPMERSESEVRLARLRSLIADLNGQVRSATAAASALAKEVENHKLRAPTTGEVGESAMKQVGAFVHAGERLATLVPSSELQAVAEFAPTSVFGRIRTGQSARLRLDAFPWTQYGVLLANVTRVSSEVREGRVRVELAIQPDPTSVIPRQHGLPGHVEVEVERVSPWTLALRAAGQIVRSQPSTTMVVR